MKIEDNVLIIMFKIIVKVKLWILLLFSMKIYNNMINVFNEVLMV